MMLAKRSAMLNVTVQALATPSSSIYALQLSSEEQQTTDVCTK